MSRSQTWTFTNITPQRPQNPHTGPEVTKSTWSWPSKYVPWPSGNHCLDATHSACPQKGEVAWGRRGKLITIMQLSSPKQNPIVVRATSEPHYCLNHDRGYESLSIGPCKVLNTCLQRNLKHRHPPTYPYNSKAIMPQPNFILKEQ